VRPVSTLVIQAMRNRVSSLVRRLIVRSLIPMNAGRLLLLIAIASWTAGTRSVRLSLSGD